MEIAIVIVFIITSVFAIFEEEEDHNYKKYVYWSIGLILVVLAGVREVGFDHDSENYEKNFLHYDDYGMSLVMEYSYIVISTICHIFSDDVHSLFFIYAFIGVGLKLFAFRKLSSMYFLPLVIYISYYFMLHEMTQIRAGIASGLFLLSLKPIAEGKKKEAALILLCALAFHYSSAILFPILLLNNKALTPKHRIGLACIIPFIYLLYFVNFNIITSIPIPFISDKLDAYEMMRDKGIMGDEINVFNHLYLVRISVYLYCLYFYDVIYEHNKYLPILLKVMGVSIASFIVFSGLPIFAIRVSELLGIVDIIVYSNIYYTIKQKYVAKAIIVLMGIILMIFNIMAVGLFDPSKAP